MTGRYAFVFSWKTAAAVVIVCTAGFLLLLGPVILLPPRDQEVWILQTICEMHESQSFLPTLGGDVLRGANPAMAYFLSLANLLDINSLRVIQAALGGLLVGITFLFTLFLFDLKSAVVSGLVAMTCLGFTDWFGSFTMHGLPAVLTAASVAVFSLAYLGRLSSKTWFFTSYVLAAMAMLTGGAFPAVFFILFVVMLALVDLAPTRLLSAGIASGLVIIVTPLLVYLAAYRILAGPGFAWPSLFGLEDTGSIKALARVISEGSPWIFLLPIAFIHPGGPSDKEAWLNVLPLRISLVLFLLMMWFWPHGSHAYSILAIPFMAALTAPWAARTTGKGPAGTAVFVLAAMGFVHVLSVALSAVLVPAVKTRMIATPQVAWAAFYLIAAIAFCILAFRHKTALLLVVMAVCSLGVGPAAATTAHADSWYDKLAFMRRISEPETLVVYEDDLVMRGYLKTVGKRPLLVGRDAVPMAAPACIAVSVDKLDDFLERESKRLNPVVLDAFRDENEYALLFVRPSSDHH